MENGITFPVYRKSKDSRTFYKILSHSNFEEVKSIGSKAVFHAITAYQMPERNYIQDLLYEYHNHWDISTEEEFEAVKRKTVF